jgi:hypothetical protein
VDGAAREVTDVSELLSLKVDIDPPLNLGAQDVESQISALEDERRDPELRQLVAGTDGEADDARDLRAKMIRAALVDRGELHAAVGQRDESGGMVDVLGKVAHQEGQ